ncbi:MAG: Nucleotidyl transferase [Candidatus Parvarchaeum acidophilus ARMAN-5]|jgi:UTP-glucose-1-phosphate uridylyltransferase|uniref:UTP--glucose-1-phosphate uridylyltransferase n=1 Tax=Candidatus Parvarchaeum acidophilus ARMAN-5 TaxID=662762 RepID=D6GUZ0_PARA5|nr:MAG: Nucleotidyl transferase [Candidatus Parvarchaeum acidophilus ARMAN-5]
MGYTEIKTAVILAAGNGSRLRPFTNFIPKTMVPYRDKPLIYHHIMNCYNNGIKDIIVVTRKDEDNDYSFRFQNEYLKDLERQLRDKDKEVRIKLIYQEEDKYLKKPKGPAAALAMAEDELRGKSYITLLGDNLIIDRHEKYESLMKNLIDIYNGCPLYYFENLDKEIAKKGGVVKGNKLNYLDKILLDTTDAIEKPNDDVIEKRFGVKDRYEVMSGGMYIFNEKSMDSIKNVKPGANNEMHLTDAINDQIKSKNSKVVGVLLKNSLYTAVDFGAINSWLSINLKEENIEEFKKAIDNYPSELRNLIYENIRKIYNNDTTKQKN